MPSERPFQIALCILYSCFTIVRVRYGWRFRPRGIWRQRTADSRLLGSLILYEIATFGVYVLAPNWLARTAIPLPSSVRWSGAALGVLSLILFIWVHCSLGENFSPVLYIRDGHTLVTNGPYRWVRHPMYTAFYVLHLAAFLLSANGFVGATWLAGLTLVVIVRVPQEERMLVGRFGTAYARYSEHTGRFLPRLNGKALPAPWQAISVRPDPRQDDP